MSPSSSSTTCFSFSVYLFVSVLLAAIGGLPTETEAQTEERVVLAEGSFEGKEGISTSGTYQIERSGQNLRLVLGESFRTEPGPDLYLVLSSKSPDEATGENVMEGRALKVDSLRSLEGPRSYDLPDDLDLEAFSSVAIQCIKYSHLYGTAKLRP